MKFYQKSLPALAFGLMSPFLASASETGSISLIDEEGLKVLTYSSGDTVRVEV